MKRIDQEKVRIGRLIRVKNQDPKPTANTWYYSVWVEDHDKGNRRALLLTENELKRAEHRSGKNPEDLPKRGWWVKMVERIRR